jgi:AsmA protein
MGGKRTRRTLLGALLVVTVVAAAVVFGGGFLLERWANARKDQLVGELQAQLGRSVKAGRLEVSWVPGFALDTAGVEIGPGSAREPGPALRIERARLRVGLWRALFSLGRRVHIKEASLAGVTANVVRFPDGTINWQQIRDRLDSKKSSAPMSESMRARLRGLVVEHAGLEDARIRFVDLVKGGATAEISDLDLAVDGAGFTEPFSAKLTAAVQGREKNLELEAGFAAPPRSEELVPLLRRLTIRLRPVDVAPLAPFLGTGALAELDEGKLAADLKIDLGAAAPGGQGSTTVKGEAHLTGARLAQGERFDGSLESDLVADAVKGDVDVRKLRLAVGAMSLVSAGKLLDLRGAPRFDRFTVTSNGLDFDALRRYYPALEKATGVVLAGPFVIAANADADSGAQRFAARIDLTSASLAVPGKLDKPAGTKLTLEVTGRAEGQTIRCERMLLAMGEARVGGQGVLEPAKKGSRPFQATMQAEPFAVRPLLALLDPRGSQNLPDMRVGAKVRVRGELGRPESMHVEVPAFSAASGASQVSGSLSLENLERPRVTLDGRAAFLDLDDFLPARSQERARAPQGKGQEPPSLLARAQGRAKLDVARGRASGIDYQNLHADLTLADGRLKAHALEVGAFGGKFSGAGSELPLAGEQQPFVAKGTVAAMDVAALLARFAPSSRVLRGSLSADIDLAGRGTRPGDLTRTLTGKLSGGLAGAEFLPTALLEPVVQALSHAVKVPALATMLAQADQRVAALRDHALGDLTGAVRIADGVLELANPVEAKTSYGTLSIGGKVRLDGRADLAGAVAVAPEVVASLLGGRVDVTEPLPIKLRITGPLRSPRISPTELEAPARVLVTAFARSAVAQGAKEQIEKVTAPAQENVKESVEKAKEAAGRRLRRLLPR